MKTIILSIKRRVLIFLIFIFFVTNVFSALLLGKEFYYLLPFLIYITSISYFNFVQYFLHKKYPDRFHKNLNF